MNVLRTKPGSVAASAFIMLAAASVTRANQDEYVKTYSVGNHPEVHIQAGDSRVRIITSDTNQVEFRVRSEGVRAAIGVGGQVNVDSQQSGNRVELTVKTTAAFTIGFDSRRIETEVRMPENADLLIDTHDGAVELSALSGNITIHTKDGSIKATQLSGRIVLDSSDGAISAESLKGEARLHCSDGSIGVDRMDGKLEASSSDGSIRVEGRFDSLNVRSGDGTVTARVARGSKMTSDWSVESKDGSLHLTIPSDLKADLDVSARNGHISVELPVTLQGIDNSRSKVRGTLNGGGPILTVRSGDGSVRLDGI